MDQRLQEFNLGILERCEYLPGITIEEKAKGYLAFHKGIIEPPGADTYSKFRNRIFSGVNDCVDGNSLVFTHSGVIRNFIEAFQIDKTYIGNLGFIIIEFDDIYEGAQIQSIYNGMI